MAKEFRGSVTIKDDLTVEDLLRLTNLNGVDFIPGSDVDTDLLTVNVTGTPKLVWDESSNAFRITGASGLVLDADGDLTHTIGGASVTSQLEVHSEGSDDLGGLAIHRHTDNNNFGGHLLFFRSDGTHASPALVDSGDTLARIVATGYDGTDYELAAEIRMIVGGTSANNDMPGAILFLTTKDGATSLTESFRVQQDQSLLFSRGDINDSVLIWNFTHEYTGSETGADKFQWTENFVTSTADSSISQIGIDVDVDLDYSGLTELGITTFAYTWLDLDFTQQISREGLSTQTFITFDVDLPTPSIGLNYYAFFKNSSVTRFTLDQAGNMFVDGATTLDSTLLVSSTATFNGAAQFNSTVTVGVNDTGHDVTFFGATSGRRFLWDESLDLLDLQGNLQVGVDGTGFVSTFFGSSASRFLRWNNTSNTLEISGTTTHTNGKTTLAAATSSIASLNFPSGTDPSSPAEGDIWLSSTSESLRVFTDGISGDLTRTLGRLTTSRTVANTTTQTVLNQNANEGQVTIPANGWAVGRTYWIKGYGIYGTDTVAPTFNLRIRIGGTEVAGTGANTLLSSISNGMWFFDALITCRTVGSSGTVFVNGILVLFNSGVAGQGQTYSLENTGTDTVNTTTSRVIDLTAQWGTANANNTFSIHNYLLVQLN